MVADLDAARLRSDLARVGLVDGDVVLVHSAMSRIGWISGGAPTLLAALLDVVGSEGTVMLPAFSRLVRSERGTPTDLLADLAADPLEKTPVGLGALPAYAVGRADAVRSPHPQAGVVAIGKRADFLCGGPQPLSFALGPGSPFDRLVEVKGKILLLGVGHNRSSMLHHCESLCPSRRLKIRRFPMAVAGEVVVVESADVADDLDTHFPVVGRRFEDVVGCASGYVGAAEARLIDAAEYVEFCVTELEALLAADV